MSNSRSTTLASKSARTRARPTTRGASRQRDSEALTVAVLTVALTLIALYDLVLLAGHVR